MIVDPLAELRRRLGVTAQQVSDETLTHILDTASALVEPWLVPDPTPYSDLVDEATVELAVKVYDISARGVTGPGAEGDWITFPAPAGTPGLVRSVFGVLGPALASGGLSV